MNRIRLRHVVLSAIVCLCTLNANAEIDITSGVRFFAGGQAQGFPIDTLGPANFPGDYALPAMGFVNIRHQPFSQGETILTVNNGSTLQSSLGLYTSVFDPSGKSEIYVDGLGSRIEIGSATIGTGNIRLNGKGDFDITNGAVVNWIEPNTCSGAFFVCDILIGATAVSNTGIRVIGTGSLLDASNTNGRLFVGYVPSLVAYDAVLETDSEDFLVVQDGGVLRSNGGAVGKGFEVPESPLPGDTLVWDASTVGYVNGTVYVDNGSWFLQGEPGSGSGLNIGEGSGGSGNVAITNGGLVDITANPGEEAGFFLGQASGGVPTEGASNLLVVDGTGSTLNIDSNLGVLAGSRIANGFVTVQNDGAIQIDSSVLLVSGNSGASLSSFNTDLAFNVGLVGLSNNNLDVLSGGSVTITDLDGAGIGALIIGQTPNLGPTQSADVRVSGSGSNITVMNDPALPKIALAATEFGIPTVSNIGTGALNVEDGGSITFDNGDFVIAARAADDATVTVTDATLTADRVIIGWADFEAGVVSVGASSGTLTLDDGVINADVVVDDNGTLNGIGTINGTLFGEGGIISGGFSPGTITVESLVLGAGTQLVMEVGLNPDGSINAAASDAIVATSGALDLSAGEVTFELSSVDINTSLDEILGTGVVLSVEELFESSEDVILASYTVTDPTGDLSDEELDQRIEILSFEKSACKKDGWQDLYRTDETAFEEQGDCIQYVNTGN